MTKTIFTALVGRPNTGKSTLLNKLLGEKISIVSRKPQTTRTRITGILTRGETQYVFLDTPGIHKPQTRLGVYMMQNADAAMTEVDLILFMVVAGDKVGETEHKLMERFKKFNVPVVLLVNKTDVASAKEIGDTIKRFSDIYSFDAVVPLSALKGDGADIVLEEIDKHTNESVWFFPSDMITDQPERQIVAEIIREKLLKTLNEEVPHGTAVVIEEFTEGNNLLKIRAEIFCEKASHKPIIIGKHGETLKHIGVMAREDLEAFFGIRVYLDLWVKIKENWRDNASTVANFGYKPE